MLDFITDVEIYERVLGEGVLGAREYVWIGTANVKDLHVDKKGKSKMVPFLETLSDLARKGVKIRLVHAREAGQAFRRDFDKYPRLLEGLERKVCPRVHFKCVVVDGVFAYSGSANLTGAGMGAKSSSRRNFESGIVTTDKGLVGKIAGQFERVWKGHYCKECKRKEYCDEH